MTGLTRRALATAGLAGLALALRAVPGAAQAPDATPAPSPSPPPAAEGDPAVQLVRALYEGIRAALKDGPGTVQSRLAATSEILTRTFDLPTMARRSIGSRFRNAPPERQSAIVEAFSRYFLAVYAVRLASAAGGTFEVQPASETREGGRLVRSKAGDAAGRDTEVNYLIGGSGRVTDVYLAGTVSEVGTMRAEFDPSLKAGGIDALETFLRQRTEQMLAPKPPG